MSEKEIVQPVLNNVLNHIMPPVLCQKYGERSQVTVGQRLFIYMVKYLFGCDLETLFKPCHQFFIKSMVQVILDHFFTEVSATSLIPKHIADARAVLHDIFSVEIAGIGTGAQDT